MKHDCRRAADRRVRYVAFKSYHTKPPVANAKISKSTDSKSAAVAVAANGQSASKTTAKKSRATKKSNTNVVQRTVSEHRGDSAEQVTLRQQLDRVRQKEAQLTDAVENLERENESLKRSLSASVPSDEHDRLQTRLRTAQQTIADIQAELERADERDRCAHRTVDEAKRQLERANRENAELNDQIELSVDKVQYLEAKVDKMRELELTVSDLRDELRASALRNDELVTANEQATHSLAELQRMVDEQRAKLAEHENVKRSLLQSRELEVRKAIDDEKEASSKFVQLLESENTNVKQKNAILVEQNARLNKDVTEMKKKMEQLRQKYDDVNKENKLLKEKETRYLIHERINVGKYSKYPATISGCEEALWRSDLRSVGNNTSTTSMLLSSSLLRSNNFTTVQKRNKQTNDYDERIRNLLHRHDNEDRTSKTKIRKN